MLAHTELARRNLLCSHYSQTQWNSRFHNLYSKQTRPLPTRKRVQKHRTVALNEPKRNNKAHACALVGEACWLKQLLEQDSHTRVQTPQDKHTHKLNSVVFKHKHAPTCECQHLFVCSKTFTRYARCCVCFTKVVFQFTNPSVSPHTHTTTTTGVKADGARVCLR